MDTMDEPIAARVRSSPINRTDIWVSTVRVRRAARAIRGAAPASAIRDRRVDGREARRGMSSARTAVHGASM
jgi:hypothetical protein